MQAAALQRFARDLHEGDPHWHDGLTQRCTLRRLEHWLAQVRKPVVIEIGAGTAVPSVRNFSQQMLIYAGARLVRINMDEAQVPSRDEVGLALAGLQALRMIDEELRALG